jgi:hypothetical protein
LDGHHDGWVHADIHHMEHVQMSKGKILYCPVRDSVSTPVWRLAITVVIAELVGFWWLSGHNVIVAAYEERTCQTKL